MAFQRVGERAPEPPCPRQSKAPRIAARAQIVDHFAIFFEELGLALQQDADTEKGRALRAQNVAVRKRAPSG